MMECSIIRDLFPSYIDGLTSEKSNQIIEEHLEECAVCQRHLEIMMTELTSKKYTELNQEQAKKEIRPFKKLGRRMFYAIIITAVVMGFLCAIYESYFTGGRSTLPGDVEVTYENTDGIVTVGLMPKKKNVYILGLGSGASDNLKDVFVPINCHVSPLTIPQERRGCYLRYIFREDGSVLYEGAYGEWIEIKGDENLTMKFGIFSISIPVDDFRTEAGAEKLRQWLKDEERNVKK